MSLEITKQWFEQAIPEPTIEQACIQIGCHLEEVEEMMDSINLGGSRAQTEAEAESLAFKKCSDYYRHKVEDCDKEALLDSIVDQIVTAVGVGHMMGMDVLGALEEINRSNFSKFEGGKPVFDVNGKITKGKDYVKPNLEKFV
ncbi:NTP pyrophosphohydrolase-like domain [Vibrio phage 1.231.O._10N.261.49.F8]|nr:NTP pyrophosphohydrolase-like domain [Vibrio phage 1.119.O._10N.261.51.A9]AUR89637.1 NTP pyrophosphohydrolase-like domain [Vibrio phage 1.127.O._10N.286.52.E12]AUR90415.1 NTP pyrophosphohydrolase-like domain [Vibrio phage 1.143.O._10N.261.55.C8]AUR96701.1 NTP pyrophosphohydrolase-like domain [Vibrio phage 1.231.O._10N.261.49.F8]